MSSSPTGSKNTPHQLVESIAAFPWLFTHLRAGVRAKKTSSGLTAPARFHWMAMFASTTTKACAHLLKMRVEVHLFTPPHFTLSAVCWLMCHLGLWPPCNALQTAQIRILLRWPLCASRETTKQWAGPPILHFVHPLRNHRAKTGVARTTDVSSTARTQTQITTVTALRASQ